MAKKFVFGLMSLILVACGSDPSAKLTIRSSTSSSASLLKSLISPTLLFAPFEPVLRSTVAGNVSSVTFRIRSLYLSTNTDCSNAVLVSDLGSGTDFDMTQSQTIFSGNPPDGTYVCVMVGMDDIITWAPDTTAQNTNAGCNPAVSETFDIYRTDGGDSPNWKDANGANITATGTGASPGRDAVYLFASSNSSALSSGALAPHTNQTVGFNSALTVPGSATFYADFTGQVSGDASNCDLEGVAFGFR